MATPLRRKPSTILTGLNGSFSIQYALVELLQSWGIYPDIVLGHSVGQYAAACVAGIMTWTDGLKLIAERGRLISELPQTGKMMAVFASRDKIEPLIADLDTVAIAATNGSHVVISGDSEVIDHLQTSLEKKNVRTRYLVTSHAFHSPLMDPILGSFQKFADSTTFEQPHLPIICNVSGSLLPVTATLDGQYWSRHIRQPVRFIEGVESAVEFGCEMMMELGPQSILTRMSAAAWPYPQSGLISCLQRDLNDVTSLQLALGNAYSQGITPDFNAIHHDFKAPPVDLPTYRFNVVVSGVRINHVLFMLNTIRLIPCWAAPFLWLVYKMKKGMKRSSIATVPPGSMIIT